jgi:SAM-dependent methyltransferase
VSEGEGQGRGVEAGTSGDRSEPWQLRMFDKTLKKKQKVKLLLGMAAPVEDRRCFLLTGGDNNGAMNHRFREAGGRWSWAEMEEDSIPDMEAFLEEKVQHATPSRLPFPDGAFDRIIVIDVHEHLEEVSALNRELARISAPGARVVVTTPNGNERLPVAFLKRILGMGPAEYGHVVQGFSWQELEEMLAGVGLEPEDRGGYSRFFTELVELAINFGYVKILSRRKGNSTVKQGTIVPSSEEQLRAVEKTYRLYSLVYPFVRAFSALDVLIPGRGGYAVAVSARKPE